MSEIVLTYNKSSYDEIILALQNGARIVRVKNYVDNVVPWSTNKAYRALKERRRWYNLRLSMDEHDLIVTKR